MRALRMEHVLPSWRAHRHPSALVLHRNSSDRYRTRLSRKFIPFTHSRSAMRCTAILSEDGTRNWSR